MLYFIGLLHARLLWVANASGRTLLVTPCDMLSALCCQDLTMRPPPAPLYLIRVAVNMTYTGALLWLNVETLERVPTPLFGEIVRCSFMELNAFGWGSYICIVYQHRAQ